MRFVPETSQLAMDIPERSRFDRFALRSITDGPTINPARATYPVGKVAVSAPVRLPVVIPVRVADVRFAPEIVEPVIVAVVADNVIPVVDPLKDPRLTPPKVLIL